MESRLAPELPQRLEWLNVDHPVRLAQLRGRVCALLFANLGSAWAMQRMHDLSRLQARYGEHLVVLAIHVPKFDHERDVLQVSRHLRRYRFGFPIAHDADWVAWQHYGVKAWPAVVLIDGDGVIRDEMVGCGSVRDLDTRIAGMIDALPLLPLDLRPIRLRRDAESNLPLQFPSGILAAGQFIYVADTEHHRVLACDRNGRVIRQYGSGSPGFVDGPMESSALCRPCALAMLHNVLYVADAGNHAVRRIHLDSGDIDTLCGAGRPGTPQPGKVAHPHATTLDQPRGLALSGDRLHISTAGDNRLWSYDLSTAELRLLAGTGALELRDGAANLAAFAGPASLALVQQTLYVCDSAASAIRSVGLRTGQVQTLVGKGLWTFGNVDGERSGASLQYPLGIALDPVSPRLWIADAGNDALRVLKLGGGVLETVRLPRPLHGPGAVAAEPGVVWIADTDAHAILRYDLASGLLAHVPVDE